MPEVLADMMKMASVTDRSPALRAFRAIQEPFTGSEDASSISSKSEQSLGAACLRHVLENAYVRVKIAKRRCAL